MHWTVQCNDLPYELVAEIFKAYVSLLQTSPEELFRVCRLWSAIANNEPTLWTKFIITRKMMSRPDDSQFDFSEHTRHWVLVFKRRLERVGPSLPLQISIFGLHEGLLPIIDVISGGAPDYIHLRRWDTLDLATGELIFAPNVEDSWRSIARLISQPTPSLKRLTLRQNKIDFRAFPDAPNLEELHILLSRSPLIGHNNGFPNLKKLCITYPSKYPLSLVHPAKISPGTIETLIIGGEVDFGESAMGTYPSLSLLEFHKRVPHGVVHMSAPNLRHLTLRNPDLFGLIYPDWESQHADSTRKNREVLEMLARRFPSVEILDVHRNLRNLVLEMIFGESVFFAGIKELWVVSTDCRERVDLTRWLGGRGNHFHWFFTDRAG
jgi:hypothetical protein